MSIINNLVRELKSLPRNPIELITFIIVALFAIDFFLKGQLKIIMYTMKYLKTLTGTSSWHFIVILFLILFWRE